MISCYSVAEMGIVLNTSILFASIDLGASRIRTLRHQPRGLRAELPRYALLQKAVRRGEEGVLGKNFILK
jgi:hypothetical protein